MLSIHLRLGLPSGLLPFGFPTNNLYTLSVIYHYEIDCGKNCLLGHSALNITDIQLILRNSLLLPSRKPWPLVRKRNIATERSPRPAKLVPNLKVKYVALSAAVNLGFLDQSPTFFYK
jgi:hypothetical protein